MSLERDPAAVEEQASARSAGATWFAASAALLVCTTVLLGLRPRLDRVHVALVYLLVVLVGSAAGGRRIGIALAGVAFFAFNFLFLPPYYTLAIADPLDWIVLASFLLTGLVAAHLLAVAQSEARAARQRAREVDRLAALGAEMLSAARAGDALSAIARALRETMGVGTCELYMWDAGHQRLELGARDTSSDRADRAPLPAPLPADGTPGAAPARGALRWVAEHGRPAALLEDDTIRLADSPDIDTLGPDEEAGVLALLIPLAVRGRVVGVLRLADGNPGILVGERRRFLDALSYYAALAVERLRLTDDAQHAAALREADRLKDQLLASVSHDLRTPLTTVRALAHEIATDGDVRALDIEEEVDRLVRFVSDLLDLSRLSAGGIPVSISLNAAEDLVGAALQRISVAAAGREVRASLEPGDPILVGRFDFSHSLRILVNLLENALKYSPASAPVDVGVRREGGELVFVVADRGPGLSPAERERVFAPFYRLPGATPDAGSAGLGLAIARGLADAQGGALQCQSRPGGGSVFLLRLPAADLELGVAPDADVVLPA
jgi:two-component system, OmpR family, sensor histidine kinase KdpD